MPTPAGTGAEKARETRSEHWITRGIVGYRAVCEARRGDDLARACRGHGLERKVHARLEGDRAVGNYESLKGKQWDVVIDNPTTLPRWVRQAAEVLKGQVGQYVFISTISTYASNDTPGADETAAMALERTGHDEQAGVRVDLAALDDLRRQARFFGGLRTIGLSTGVITSRLALRVSA